jgi:lauroyl/myristoyl acyltransferase
MIKQINKIAEKYILKAALMVPLDSYRFRIILIIVTLWDMLHCLKKIKNFLRYQKAMKNFQHSVIFIFNCFLSANYDWLFKDLIAENPQKYLQYVSIEGEESVRRLMEQDTGVLLIAGHFGPFFLTLLFKEFFGIRTSSFASVDNKKYFTTSSKKKDKIISSNPIYAVGEETQMQEGLLKKQWIKFYNDVPVAKRRSHHSTLFGRNVYMSELPFKISLKYNIPILFIGVRKNKYQYHLSITPLDDFDTQQEGLRKYMASIEKLLCRDPYSGCYIAMEHF